MSGPKVLPEHLANEDKGPTILAVCISLTALATLFVAARLYVRGKIQSHIGLDDWLMILSMASIFSRALPTSQDTDALSRYVATSCLA